jgi:hypothetical protein
MKEKKLFFKVFPPSRRVDTSVGVQKDTSSLTLVIVQRKYSCLLCNFIGVCGERGNSDSGKWSEEERGREENGFGRAREMKGNGEKEDVR